MDVSTGKECAGCGQQEQFYGCSDIAIIEDKDTETKSQQQNLQSLNGGSHRINTTYRSFGVDDAVITQPLTVSRPSTTWSHDSQPADRKNENGMTSEITTLPNGLSKLNGVLEFSLEGGNYLIFPNKRNVEINITNYMEPLSRFTRSLPPHKRLLKPQNLSDTTSNQMFSEQLLSHRKNESRQMLLQRFLKQSVQQLTPDTLEGNYKSLKIKQPSHSRSDGENEMYTQKHKAVREKPPNKKVKSHLISPKSLLGILYGFVPR